METVRGGLEGRAERNEGALEDCGGAGAGKVYKIPEAAERKQAKISTCAGL